ncbi:MAG: PEP-CTERM sorting domain-containing protein [Planctomycetota bacterium]
MIRVSTAGLLAALVATPLTAQVTTYTENFDDGNAATRFSAPVVNSEVGVFDGSVDYAFDYGAIGIPSAPNSGGTTTGVLMQTNLTDNGPVDEGETFYIAPLSGDSLPDEYIVKMDLFFNSEFESSGSTEYGMFGLHRTGANDPGDASLTDDAAFPLFEIGDGDGFAWYLNGDGGTGSSDFGYVIDPGNNDTGSDEPQGSYQADIPLGSVPGLSNGPSGTGFDENWITLEMSKLGDVLTLAVNGVDIFSYTDTADELNGGGIYLGYSDVFNSVGTPDLPVGPDPDPFDNVPFGDQYPNLAHFLIYDNIEIIEVPEPATGALLLAGGACLLRRRKA